jgi:hypothetical protein
MMEYMDWELCVEKMEFMGGKREGRAGYVDYGLQVPVLNNNNRL